LANPPTSDQPGTEFSYSSTNYLLLGEIIEKVSGRSYGEQIERRIVHPLGLRGTTVPGTSERIPGPHPHGYIPVAEDGRTRLVDYTTMNPSIMGAGGEIISTTADLDTFFAALLGGRLLPAHLRTQMTTAGIDGGRYGLGMFLMTTTCGTRVYGHDGDALAYQSWSYSTADARRQVTIALTPNFRSDLDDAVDAYLDKVFCG
jgi:D-alanyl-D-alanine carboxypeptidase